MKSDNDFDARLAAARPADYRQSNDTFTNKVMQEVGGTEPMSNMLPATKKGKRQTLFTKLRHLPSFAVAVLLLSTFFVAAGTAYAVVQTVVQLTQVKLDESHLNETGRKELNVTFNSCDEQKKIGTTYELKRDSGLSAEDGLKVLQAKCDIDIAQKWLESNPRMKEIFGGRIAAQVPMYAGGTGTIKSITSDTLSFQEELEQKPLTEDMTVIADGKVIPLSSLKPGDVVLYFTSISRAIDKTIATSDRVIFKFSRPAKYYDYRLQSYIKVRTACKGNPMRTCLESNNINHVTLLVTNGGGAFSYDDNARIENRRVQGKVVEYGDTFIKLNVGKGVILTLETPYNVIANYNEKKVYGLAAYDPVYAKTDPEALKIGVGDSLDIYYTEDKGVFATTIPWQQLSMIDLMVERKADDLEVLQKY